MQMDIEDHEPRRGTAFGIAVLAIVAAALTPFVAPYLAPYL